MEAIMKVVNDISKITNQLDETIQSILSQYDEEQKSLDDQITEFAQQKQYPLIQLADNSNDLNNSTISNSQTPRKTTPALAKATIQKPLINDQKKQESELKQVEQAKKSLIEQQNKLIEQQRVFIEQQEYQREEYLSKLQNQQVLNNSLGQKLKRDRLKFRLLKQEVINYKNSLILQQQQQEKKQEQRLLYFVEDDLQQIQKINFNYVDVFNLQQQVLQVTQGNIQLFQNTMNQMESYYKHIQQEKIRQQQEREQELIKQQQEILLKQQKEQQDEKDKQIQNEIELQKQQKLKEDVIKQQLDKQKLLDEEFEKQKQNQQATSKDDEDNLSDTQEMSIECTNCSQAIKEDNIQLNCLHSYHFLCLIQRIMSHQTSYIKCFCNEIIPFKIIDKVLSTNPENQKYYQEFKKNRIQTILTNSQHPYTNCEKCGFVYFSEEKCTVNQCSECTVG